MYPPQSVSRAPAVSPGSPDALHAPKINCTRIALYAVGVLATLAIAYATIPYIAGYLAGKSMIMLVAGATAMVALPTYFTCSIYSKRAESAPSHSVFHSPQPLRAVNPTLLDTPPAATPYDRLSLTELLQNKNWLQELSNATPGDDFCRRWTNVALNFVFERGILETLRLECDVLFEKQVLKADNEVGPGGSLSKYIEDSIKDVKDFEELFRLLSSKAFRFKLISPDKEPCRNLVITYLKKNADTILNFDNPVNFMIVIYKFVPVELLPAVEKAIAGMKAIPREPVFQYQEKLKPVGAALKGAIDALE